MGDFMIQIREELKNYEIILHNDLEEFRKKLNTTRTDLFSYVQRQIKYLNNVLEEYKQEFDYLDQENEKTCDDNLQQFHRLCLSINQNDKNQVVVKKLLQNFQSAFTMRPNMLKYIPEYYFKDIHIDDFIKKQIPNESLLILPKNYYNSYSTIMNGYLSTDKNESDHHDDSLSNDQSEYLRLSNRFSSAKEHSFIPVESTSIDNLKIPPVKSSSMGFSYHKEMASQNNQIEIESKSRLVSTCSTIPEPDMRIDLLFEVPYQHNRNSCLVAYHENENFLLIYSLTSHQLEHFNSYIIFLNRLNNTNKCMIAIHDSDTLDRLRSFDLIDAILPLSMVSSYQRSRSTTTTSNNQLEPLLFVNDVKSHVIHCCTYEQYLISIQINAFGICPLDDGNLILVTSRDIRGLKVQNYLQRNNV
ncbi:unnamed protein product [Rotaria sordida]|uniref:Uncharacterized protein n=1 Tax=Rotaria sordida TaxID=392033 RepID=A0A814CHK4_9BILA|nr:unnamed protein product [Rotaria sordida]